MRKIEKTREVFGSWRTSFRKEDGTGEQDSDDQHDAPGDELRAKRSKDHADDSADHQDACNVRKIDERFLHVSVLNSNTF